MDEDKQWGSRTKPLNPLSEHQFCMQRWRPNSKARSRKWNNFVLSRTLVNTSVISSCLLKSSFQARSFNFCFNVSLHVDVIKIASQPGMCEVWVSLVMSILSFVITQKWLQLLSQKSFRFCSTMKFYFAILLDWLFSTTKIVFLGHACQVSTD